MVTDYPRWLKAIVIGLFALAVANVAFLGYWRWWLDREGIIAPMLPEAENIPMAPLPPPFN